MSTTKATTKASPAVAALQEAEATLRALRADRAANMARLLEIHMDLARAQTSGNVEAIGAAHDASEEVLARDRRFEAIEDSVVVGVAKLRKPVDEERSAAATTQAQVIGSRVQEGVEEVCSGLGSLVARLDGLVKEQSDFDVLRGRARSAASAAGIDTPQVGKINAPFAAWAADLRAVLAMMEARKNV